METEDIDTMKTYWNHEGTYQDLVEELQDAVGPDNQPLPKKSALERFRKATICYYDLYNNGLYNRVMLAVKVFGMKVSDYKNYSFYLNDDHNKEKTLHLAKEQNINLESRIYYYFSSSK